MAERSWGDAVLRPKVVFGVLAAVIVLVLLVAPESDIGEGTPALTTHSSQAYGALGFYRVVERLGWRVDRRTSWMRTALDTNATYALLDPPSPLTSAEVHNLLEAVRRGAGLFVVVPVQGSLADSLHVRTAHRYGMFGQAASDSVAGVDTVDDVRVDSIGDDLWLNSYFKLTTAAPASSVTFLGIRVGRTARPVVLGVPFGAGRVVMVAEANLIRNGILRSGNGGIPVVRALEWIAPPGARPVVFDEYHFGYGEHGSMLRTVRHSLYATTAGRAALQLALAGLVLLVAVGARPIPPRERETIERRSPLEHVGALARAYEQVGATRLATRRLVRGLRRRRPLGVARARGRADDDYLTTVAERFPATAADVSAVRAATERAATPAQFAAVGDAIDNIERTVSQ